MWSIVLYVIFIIKVIEIFDEMNNNYCGERTSQVARFDEICGNW